MYSDTHFHFMNLTERLGKEEACNVLKGLISNNCFFGMDIGTSCDDLIPRIECIEEILKNNFTPQMQQSVKSFLHYSAGIWPDKDTILNRDSYLITLEKQIKQAEDRGIKICAIGEGGIEHHWNNEESGFTESELEGERELFYNQLNLAKKMDLPFILHSRDGFKDTIEVMKENGWQKGIVHCFSYGIEEAKQFLDTGWYISLSGTVTYAKKSKIQEMADLVNYIPEDRLLLETDSPFLCPVPHRGKINTPLYIKHTYEAVAQYRQISVEYLSAVVDENIKKLLSF